MNALNEEWKNYRLRVIPLDASAYQAAETQRAYFAGAGAVLKLLLAVGGFFGHQNKAIEDLRLEVERFRADVAAGRA